MKISREDVLRVSELAYLDLTDAELETYRSQLDNILEYIGKLNALDTSNVEPMAQVLAQSESSNHQATLPSQGATQDQPDATLRDDIVVPCIVASEILAQAPDPEPPYFRVPKVIDR